jgi:hypothetical protein
MVVVSACRYTCPGDQCVCFFVQKIGGLGVEVLEIKNKCLLCKWLFKLLTENRVWHELITNKYLHSKSLSQITVKPSGSPFGKD